MILVSIYTFLKYHCKALLIGALCFFNVAAQAQNFEFNNKRKRETLSFQLVKNLMIIPLYINGQGPFNFILDTGVGLFIITDTTLIDKLNIDHLRSIKLAGFGEGEELTAYVTPSIQVEIGKATAKSMPAAILKKDIFDLSSFVGMRIHGLVGFEFFNSFLVRINYLTNTVTFYRPETSYILKKGTRIPITIEERKPYILSNIKLSNGEKVEAKLIIDTGAGHPISLETNFGVPFPLPEKNIPANLGVGLSGIINGSLGRIASIKLGNFIIKNVITAFPNYDDVAAKITSIDRNGNIGNEILRRFNVLFDYKHQYIYLKPTPELKTPFEHDMSGMELTTDDSDFNRIFISRVEPKSPANKIGLQIGDEIVSINFKSASEIPLQEITRMFRARDGQSYFLKVVKTTKKIQQVILTLERRI